MLTDRVLPQRVAQHGSDLVRVVSIELFLPARDSVEQEEANNEHSHHNGTAAERFVERNQRRFIVELRWAGADIVQQKVKNKDQRRQRSADVLVAITM